MFRFQSYYLFLLLIPLTFLIITRLRRRAGGVLFGDLRRLSHVPKTFRQRLLFLPPCLLYVALFLLVIAIARPQSGRDEYRVRHDGIAIAFCLDKSDSMKAVDFRIDGKRVDRLDAAKRTFRDFVVGNGEKLAGRPDDMIAVLAFGGYVDTCCPLTTDHQTLIDLLDGIRLPQPLFDNRNRVIMPGLYQEESRTAIGDAIAAAVERLRESTMKSKVIVLLSDGEQTTGVLTPDEGAEVAKTFGIKVYTIAIGSTGLAPFPIYMGNEMYYEQRPVTLDEETLKRIAEKTNARYYNAKTTTALEEVYEEIDKLERTEHEGKTYTQYAELYQYFLIPAICLLLIRWLLNTTVLRVVE